MIAQGSRDIYYRKAKEYGYRARSAFKLLHCDESCNIFPRHIPSFSASSSSSSSSSPPLTPPRPISLAVDLCAAPGSWSQVLVRKIYANNQQQQLGEEGEVGGGGGKVVDGIGSKSHDLHKPRLQIPKDPLSYRIISVDLQEMAPLEGVHIIRGDITSEQTSKQIIGYFKQKKCDLVISDGAPDVTGIHCIDEYMQSQLLLSAVNISTSLLIDNGYFIAKIFRSEAYDLLYSQLLIFFSQVQCIKPPSSRLKSAEHFIVCKGFRIPKNYQPVFSDASAATASSSSSAASTSSSSANTAVKLMPFLRCGDLSSFDSLTASQQQQQLSQQSLSCTDFLKGLI